MVGDGRPLGGPGVIGRSADPELVEHGPEHLDPGVGRQPAGHDGDRERDLTLDPANEVTTSRSATVIPIWIPSTDAGDHGVPPCRRAAAMWTGPALGGHGPAKRVPMTTLTYRPVPVLAGPLGRPRLAERRDDVRPVGLELGFLVAIHEVQVELVDAGIRELAQLGDLLIGAAQDAEAVGHLVADERRIR
jgi:hypothetical protein